MRLAILRELSRGPAPLALLVAAAGRSNIASALAQMERDGLVVRDGTQWLATRRATDAVATIETCDAIDSRANDWTVAAGLALAAALLPTRVFWYAYGPAMAVALLVLGARLYARGARRRAAVVVAGHPEGQPLQDIAERNRIRKTEG